jgi:hypothetical protein
MEAAPRPSPELLVDLPLEEPLDTPAVPRGEPPTLVSAAQVPPEQTDLHFMDPELFLAPDDPSGARPMAPPVAPPLEQPGAELELQDPIVDELLISPIPPPPPAPRAAAAPPVILTGTPPAAAAPPEAGSVRGAPRPASNDAQAGTSMRVPIAKTAALSAAAAKLAAASAAHQQRSPGRTASPAVSPVVPAARPAPPSTAAAPPKPAPAVQAPRVGAPSLASWASARAAATPRPAPALVASATLRAVAPAPAPPAPVQPAAAPTAAAAAPAPMDRDFIARNQVIERYLSGRLPLKGATDFERFCHQHPELLDEIGLTDRVHAGVRLLEASGKPEPWQEAARPVWQRPQLILGLAAAVLVLGAALAIVAGGSAAKSHRIIALQKQAFERALDPATSTREIRLLPSRSGASNTPAITIGGGSTQLADFKIDESRSPYHSFRVTIDRIDQGRVGVITNLAKDTNGHLRIALNSSALGPGNYQLTIEGLNWHGDPEPDSWITIGVQR